MLVGGMACLSTMSVRSTMASVMLGKHRDLNNGHDGWKVDVDVCGMMSA
jgi:hypothetical protein